TEVCIFRINVAEQAHQVGDANLRGMAPECVGSGSLDVRTPVPGRLQQEVELLHGKEFSFREDAQRVDADLSGAILEVPIQSVVMKGPEAFEGPQAVYPLQ